MGVIVTNLIRHEERGLKKKNKKPTTFRFSQKAAVAEAIAVPLPQVISLWSSLKSAVARGRTGEGPNHEKTKI